MILQELKVSPILAALAITYGGSSHPNYLDEEVAMPSAEGSSLLRAVSDSADGSPLIAVTSLSDAPQQVTLRCLGENGRNGSRSLDLAANSTVVTRACTNLSTSESDLETVLEQRKETESGPIGIALVPTLCQDPLLLSRLPLIGGMSRTSSAQLLSLIPK